jgi:RNA polymerase sigma factor (sigma-70 family)
MTVELAFEDWTGAPELRMARAPRAATSESAAAAGPAVHDVGQLFLEFSRHLEALVRDDVRACDAVIEDACQLAWTQLVRHRHRVALQSAPRWLTKTAIREAVRLIARHKRECSLELLIDEGLDITLDVEADSLAGRERLLGLGALPERQQRMMWLRGLGLSYDEVAEHEGCTFRTVERQLWRARHRLRALESGEGDLSG